MSFILLNLPELLDMFVVVSWFGGQGLKSIGSKGPSLPGMVSFGRYVSFEGYQNAFHVKSLILMILLKYRQDKYQISPRGPRKQNHFSGPRWYTGLVMVVCVT